MFIGHYGVGLASKNIAKKVSLGTLIFAVLFVDLLWPTLLLLGIEHVQIVPGITTVTPFDFVSYPISHSLLMVTIWGALFGLVHWFFKRDKRLAVILGLCVISHWVLDLMVHRPDLPIIPGGTLLVGFSIWNSLIATLLLESLFFFGGIYFYLKSTKAVNRTGKIAFWGLGIFLAVMYLANVFGPLPPDTTTVAWAGQLQWLMVVWGYWIDRNRTSVK